MLYPRRMMHRRVALLFAFSLAACAEASSPPAPATSATGAPFRVAIIEVGAAGVTVELVNGRDVEADVVLHVNVASSAGLAHAQSPSFETLAPLERRTLTVPRGRVPAFEGAAQLSVSAGVDFDDGVHRTPTSAPIAIVSDGAIWTPGDPDQAIASPRPLFGLAWFLDRLYGFV
jgi:hypothetical protein